MYSVSIHRNLLIERLRAVTEAEEAGKKEPKKEPEKKEPEKSKKSDNKPSAKKEPEKKSPPTPPKKSSPPSLPSLAQAAGAGKPPALTAKSSQPKSGLPSLATLAGHETSVRDSEKAKHAARNIPAWAWKGLPSPDQLAKSAAGAHHQPSGEEDIPFAEPGSVKDSPEDSQAIDMDTFGTKSPSGKREKPMKADAGPSHHGGESPEDAFDDMVHRQTGSTKSIKEPRSYKLGDIIDVGRTRGLKVIKHVGDIYYLQRGDKKYMYNPNRPFLGLKGL